MHERSMLGKGENSRSGGVKSGEMGQKVLFIKRRHLMKRSEKNPFNFFS